MPTKKQALRPSRTKPAASKPGAKAHKPRPKVPLAPKAAVSRPRAFEAHVTAKPKRPPTRGDQVIALLQRKAGATIEEMVGKFGIQPHSIRAVISVESRKRGLSIERVGKAHYLVI